MQKGIFTISLDFELFWGVRDHRSLDHYGDNIHSVHKIVPRLLELFKTYDIHCTWATVGFLFFNNKEELLDGLPSLRPSYIKKEYDPYDYICKNDLATSFHFAPGLIEQIKNTKGQEIATHTFSHFYTLERNTTTDQFRADLQAAIDIAKKKGFQLNSIIFPRNQYSGEHINICREVGLKVYRGNEYSKAYKPVSRDKENQFRRAVRLIDAYYNITGHHCYKIPGYEEIIDIPASRFLRPYDPGLKVFDSLRLKRIQNGLKYAAENSLIYHLWWHPHNFGTYIDENFQFLEKVFKYYSQLSNEGKMHSLNMIEIYTGIKESNERI